GEDSGTPTETHHTPSLAAHPTSHTTHSSPTLPHVTTASIPTVTSSKTTPIRQYTRRVRIAQSSAIPPVADEPASPLRDVIEGEACPSDSGFIVDQDRANIAKTSTLPYDSAPRVPSPAAAEGSMQQTLNELEISRLKARVKLLEDRDGVDAKRSRDDAPIKRRNLDEGEATAKRVSDDTEEMETVLTFMDAATVLASGVAKVPTGSGSIPTAEIVRIHAEEELQSMIDGLDRSNETLAKYLQEYQQFALELPLERRIELISDLVRYQDNYAKELHLKKLKQSSLQSGSSSKTIPMGSIEEAERLKRKGRSLEQESVKKLKTSEEVTEEAKSPDEVPEEKVEEMMQLVPIEEVHALVKESLSNRPPTSDKEMELWVELKRLYEPDDVDPLCTHTQNLMHASLEWRLYDTCEVHHVTTKDKEIFMLVEKDYPLRKGLAIGMISYKLQGRIAGNKMHKAFPLLVIEFPLAEDVPTASEESCHCQKKRKATAVKITLLLKSRRNYQSKTVALSSRSCSKEHQTKYTSPALNQKVFANIKRVGKGFSGVETPLFEGMIVEQQVADGDDEVHDEGVRATGIVAEAITRRVEHLELDKIAQALEINKLKQRLKKLEMRNKLKGGIIENINVDEDVVLEDARDVAVKKSVDVEDNADIQGRTAESQAKIYKIELDHANKVLSMQEEETEPIELQEVVDVVTTAKIITEVVTAASTTITDVLIPAATTAAALTLITAPKSTTKSIIIHSEAKSKDKGKGILVEEPKPLKKQAQIEQDEKYARELEAELNKNIDWDEVIDHVQKKQKEDKYVKRRRKEVVIRDPKESTTTSIIIHSEAKSKDKGKEILVEEPKPLKKQAQIEQDEKYARELEAELNKNIDWDEVIDHVQKKQKEDKYVKRYQALKRKPQTEAQARKNMMVYLKNVVGFKMHYFKVGDLTSHSTKYTSPALTQKVFANIRWVGKGFSGVDTPLFEGMLVVQEVGKGDADEVNVKDVNAAGVATEGVVSAGNDVAPTADEEPSIPSPTPPTPPPQPSQDIPLTFQVHLTLPQSPQVQPQSPQHQTQPSQDAEISMNLFQDLMNTCTALTRRKLEKRNKLKVLNLRRLKRVGSAQRIDSSDDTVMEDVQDVATDAKDGQDADVQDNDDIQGRRAESQVEIYKIDLDHANKVLSMHEEELKPAELQEGRRAESQAEIYKIDLDHANKVLSMHEEELKPAELQEVVDIVTTVKIIIEVVTATSTTINVVNVPILAATTATAPTLTVAPSRRTKGVVIRDLEETTTTSTIIYSEAKSKDKGKGILKKQKEDKYVKRYQALKRKPQTEAQARKNIMVYLKNVAGFKMHYFKGMSYDDIHPIFEKHFEANVAFPLKKKKKIDEEENRALKRLNESKEEKVAKKQKLDEEVKELKRHL
nr:hypothetical protein [Tanacetum cinerariifolium]